MVKNIDYLIKILWFLIMPLGLFIFIYGMDESYELTGVETKFFVQDLVSFDHTYFPKITDEYMRERNIYRIDYNLLSGSLDFKNIRRNSDQVIVGKIIFTGFLMRTPYYTERQGLDFRLKGQDCFIENLPVLDNNIHELFQNISVDNRRNLLIIEYSTRKYGIIQRETYQKIENEE